MPRHEFVTSMFQNMVTISLGHRILPVEEVIASTADKLCSVHEVVDDREGVRFFTTHHGFCTGTLPKNFVPCTTGFPLHVEPREGFPDGWIRTPADEVRFDRHCHPNAPVIESVEELVEYLNQHYAPE